MATENPYNPDRSRGAYLLVRKRPTKDERFEELSVRLRERFQIDAYRSAHALFGDGMALLHKGDPGLLEEIGGGLSSYGYRWCVVAGERFRQAPVLVRGLEMDKHGMHFLDRTGTRHSLTNHRRVVAVLADMKARLVQKLMRMAAIQGDRRAALKEIEKYETILTSKPLLDLMILDDDPVAGPDQAVLAHLRFAPARFDVSGLGEYADVSSSRNIDRIVRLSRKFAGSFHLDLNFGLGQLPYCSVGSGDEPAVYQDNLRALNQYDFYVLQLLLQSEGRKGDPRYAVSAPSRATAAPEAASVAAAAALGAGSASLPEGGSSPTLAAFGEAVRKAAGEPSFPDSVAGTSVDPFGSSILPPPPVSPTESLGVRANWKWFLALATMLAFALLAPAAASEGWKRLLLVFGVRYGVFFWLASLGLYYGSYRYFRLKRWIDDTPTSKARSVAMGMVEMTGTAERAYHLVSPYTHVNAIWYRVTKYRRRGDDWDITSRYESGCVPFYLRDETGQVRVDPAGAEIRPMRKETIHNPGVLGSTGILASVTATGFDRDEKVVEELIPDLARIYVIGFAAPSDAGRAPLSRRVAEKLRLLKQDRNALMKTYDANGDGRIDESEWAKAVADTEERALRERLQRTETPAGPETDVLIRRPDVGGLPFFIAEASERGLSINFKIYGIAFFLGGLIVMGVGIAVVNGAF